MIVTTRELYEVAYGRFAIGAYNINNMEQALGLFEGHVRADAPFIIQISRGARKYARFIEHRSEKLQSKGVLPQVRKALSRKRS